MITPGDETDKRDMIRYYKKLKRKEKNGTR